MEPEKKGFPEMKNTHHNARFPKEGGLRRFE